jgi:predicted DNA binding CopG/RHH family protein
MKREKSITFRVNDLEDERIKTMAAKRQKPVAEYLRWLVDRDQVAIEQEP